MKQMKTRLSWEDWATLVNGDLWWQEYCRRTARSPLSFMVCPWPLELLEP